MPATSAAIRRANKVLDFCRSWISYLDDAVIPNGAIRFLHLRFATVVFPGLGFRGTPCVVSIRRVQKQRTGNSVRTR